MCLSQVKAVVHLLLSKLDTPSQPVSQTIPFFYPPIPLLLPPPPPHQVQEAIANCLPPLATVVKRDAEDILNKLMDKVRERVMTRITLG